MTQETPATSEPNDNWDAAPKDGSAISIEFPNGTPALARWNANTGPAPQWEVRDSAGCWRGMKYWHGTSTPTHWWPMIQIPREALAQWAATKPTIGVLYVFGGYAAGTAHAGSDLDLAFDFVGVDEQLAELIVNAERWKVELNQLTGLVVKDLCLSTDSRPEAAGACFQPVPARRAGRTAAVVVAVAALKSEMVGKRA